MEATVTVADIAWPERCPVLGTELLYPARNGEQKDRAGQTPDNYPTLDRWDNAKGYVPGNVFVISMRANMIKNNAKWQELDAVARYARDGLVRCVADTENSNP